MTENLIHVTEVLVGTTKSGKNKYWQKQILGIEGQIHTRSIFWQDGSVVTQATPTLIERKNVGKSNETSELEQAFLEVESEVKRQQDKGYVWLHLSGHRSLPQLPLPMLAHEFTKHSAKLPEIVVLQGKEDGVRCLTNSKNFWTRKGKPFIPEIANRFSFESVDDITLDGELILPAPYSFQDTVSAVKKYSHLTDLLEYRVYDIVDEGLTFEERFNKLILLNLSHPIVVTGTLFVDKSNIDSYHKMFVTNGYEGTMIRNPNSPYEINKRSYSLLKLKDFLADEFEIVDVLEGKGKEKGLAIFTCKTPEGLEFNCRPEGTEEYRAGLFKDKDNLIGQLLTVRFQNLTQDKKPRFPIGISLRNYE